MKNRPFKEFARDLARTTLGPALAVGVSIYHRVNVRRIAEQSVNEKVANQASSPFPIDAVYTWVDDSDSSWLAKKQRYDRSPVDTSASALGSRHQTKFHNRDELRYSLRSIERFVPFIRNVYIVTDDQRPHWLDVSHPKINVVSHHQIFPNTDALPTFNSHAIEACLHRINGLSERYLYLNDDFFFGRPVAWSYFFTSDGRALVYLSPATVDNSAPHAGDTGLESSFKNDRFLLQSTFGKTIHNKVLHAPYAQSKTVVNEMEDRYQEMFEKTRFNRFKDTSDISVATALAQYYAYYTNRAVLKQLTDSALKFKYINVASPLLRPTLKHILGSRSFHCFCINEPISEYVDTDYFDHIVTDFLRDYFPDKSSFEL